jgi:hypothetical protein
MRQAYLANEEASHVPVCNALILRPDFREAPVLPGKGGTIHRHFLPPGVRHA